MPAMQMAQSKNIIHLELEVDKWLDIATLDLNDQKNQGNQYQSLSKQRCLRHTPTTRILPPIRTPMQQKSDCHQHKYFPITSQQLGKQFRMKIGEHLTEHGS